MSTPKHSRADGKGQGARAATGRGKPAAAVVAVKQPWRPMGQRRQIASIESAITRALQWAVFEPNGEALWARARADVEALLMQEWQRGNLRGNTRDEAFFVRCDRGTTTDFDLSHARFIMVVGVACVKPSEFVILRVQQSTAG